ncbi:Cryptochrome/DNA photolyase, FAD-binding domain [Dillenia turbinata]|uniref:Cryptochrome/DNA photolyase, FAD-binding domain n=1 Tax=Dillenia turbinata TaxID=194707 RepID=A0AAN8ULG2_9MAGN
MESTSGWPKEKAFSAGEKTMITTSTPQRVQSSLAFLNKPDLRFEKVTCKWKGKGIGIVWFRNDLRVLDNEVLYTAWDSCEALLPVYCVDPRLFSTTHFFAFPKTGGWKLTVFANYRCCYWAALRAQFLIECLVDLKNNLMKRGLNLLIQNGKPEKILPSLAEAYGAHTVFALKETCHEEILVERRISEALQNVMLPPSAEQTITRSSTKNPKLKLVWGHTMYHINDLPFDVANLPDVYTQFRKAVEYKCQVRGTIKMPMSLGPPPKNVGDWGCPPSLDQLGLQTQKAGFGAGLQRDTEWDARSKLFYKILSMACIRELSPHVIYEEVKRYEKERVANESTYWVHVKSRTAGMVEVICTVFSSIEKFLTKLLAFFLIVCSFLVRDMGVDWRMGAEWFETCLLDYDPCSNYGNWTYGAGVGNDPREDRYFSIPKQAQTYDPEGEYVAYWLPELRTLAKDERHSPGGSYIPQIVPLKHGNAYNRHNGSGSRSGAYARPRSRNFRSAQAKTEDRKGGPSGKQIGGNIYDSTLVYNSTIGKISTCLSVD